MKKTILILLLLLTIGVFLNGMWYETCDMFYPAQCDPNNGNAPALMVDGSSALLEAHLHYTAAVNLVQQGDLNGVDMAKLRYRINNTVEKIQLAQQSFAALSMEVQSLQVNPYYLDIMQHFDYVTFGEQKGYIAEIYEEVQEYLSAGDLTGTIELTNQSSIAILEGAQIMQTLVLQDEVPTRADLHELNQKFMEIILFSQYVADVCREIKNS